MGVFWSGGTSGIMPLLNESPASVILQREFAEA